MRGADLVAAALSNAGVKVIFTLSGNQIMPIYDACIDVGIRLIHTRHEGAATYMAEAYTQLTGDVAIAMITAAPGYASGIGPLYMARIAENPIVLLSGDSPLCDDGKGPFQELDQVSISKPLTKLSFRSTHAKELGADIAKAIRVAKSGRPGPVHLALPFDLLNAEAGNVSLPTASDYSPETMLPKPDVLRSIVDAISTASRPVILTGPSQNPTRSGGDLERLANALDLPVIPMESPRGLSDPCLGAIAETLSQADVIVSLGKNMDFSTGFARPPAMGVDCTFYVIDAETDVLERARRALGSRMVLGHRADPKAALQALIEMGKGGSTHHAWREEMAKAIASRVKEPAETSAGPMRPAILCAAVQRLLDAADDPILIVDGGEFGQWAQAFITAKTRIINGPSGAIGGGLCYALAAKIARPDATVVVLMGDGTVGFHFAEFETAVRYGTDFIAVVGQDSRWNAEYQIQLREYGADRINEVELNQTRYDLAVEGLGGHGEFVTDPADLDGALRRADESGLPVCFVGKIEGLAAPSGAGH